MTEGYWIRPVRTDGKRGDIIKYVVRLSDKDKAELVNIVKEGSRPSKTILRANILLALDIRSKRYMTGSQIAKAYHTTPATVENVKASYCEKGLEPTINRKKREVPSVARKVTGEVEARVVAFAREEPPEGYSKWTLCLLANKAVELGYVKSISHETVSRILKKQI